MLQGKPYLCFFLFFFASGFMLLAQQPELVLPTAHTAVIRSAQFSPDNKFVLTSGADKIVNVWETFSGRKIRSLGGNNGDISYAFFSNDSRYMAVGTDSSLIIWSVPSYKLLGEFSGIRRSLFSPDSKRIFLLGYNGSVKQVSLLSMKKEYEYNDSINYQYDYNWVMNRVGISPDSKFVATAGNTFVVIREIASGRILTKKRLAGHPINCFFTNDGLNLVTVTGNGLQKIGLKNNFTVSTIARIEVESAFLSHNNRFLLTCNSLRDEVIMLWDFEKYKPIFRSDTVRSRLDTIMVIDKDDNVSYQNGTAGMPFPHRLVFFSSITISDNGEYIRAMTTLWNNADNSKSYEIEDNFLHRADISRDGRYILIRQKEDGPVGLWDIGMKKLILSYENRTNKIKTADISPDGKKMLVGDESNTAEICNINTGQVIHRLHHEARIANAVFSKDGTTVLTNSYDSTAKLWDTETGLLMRTFPGQYPETNSAYFDWQGAIIRPRVDNDTVPLVDTMNPDSITGYLVNPRMFEIWHFANRITKTSAGGRYRLEKGDDWSQELVDTLKKNSVTFWEDNHLAVFSKDEKLLAFANPAIDDTLKVWSIEERKWISYSSLHTSPGGRFGQKGIGQLFFTADNNYLVAVDLNTRIHVLSVPSFRELFSFAGESCHVSADSKFLLAINQGKCDIYDMAKQQLLYSYIRVDSVNHLVIDASKRFDGTETARKLLYFSCGNEIVELDRVKDQLWVPGLVERIMKGDTINAKTLGQLEICGLTPEIEDASSKSDEYYFKITPRRGGLGETILSINGTPTKNYKPEQLSKNGNVYELIIKKGELGSYFITGKENLVTVKAYTSDNAISSRGLKITEDKTKEITTPPNLYAVMIGVSEYKGDELDLKYAAKDATDISSVVSHAAKKMLNTDSTEHVFMYNLTTAQVHYQLPEKNSIKKILEEIGKKAMANDILLIFFAGHGVMSGEADKKQFYFLTADASQSSSASAVADVGISTSELTEWMKPQHIKAQKRILIFDACNSGQAINDFVKMGTDNQNYLAARNDDKTQQIKAIDKLNEKSGLFILSASATNQSAYEMGRYSQGLLTYSLLKAIKQQPDILDQGKYLDISRWFNAAKESVSDLAKESGARQEPQIVSNTNFNIGLVDAEVMADIILPQEKPLFASSNFQNSDEAADGDNLDISKIINLQLNEMATRGTDSKIVYAMATNSPDAFTLGGRYDVTGNEVIVRISIKKHNETKHRFEEKGTTDKLKELANSIVTKAAIWTGANK
ncbi:MAG: caspase family protein [Chitinophagaceae bacterium]